MTGRSSPLRRALDININCSLAYGTLGTVLAWAGVPDESIANNEFALKINPGDPINSHRYFGLALAHYLAFRHEKALDYATVTLQLRPEWWLAHIVYTACLAQAGRSADAQSARAELQRVRPQITIAALGDLPFAKASDREHVADGLRKAGLPQT